MPSWETDFLKNTNWSAYEVYSLQNGKLDYLLGSKLDWSEPHKAAEGKGKYLSPSDEKHTVPIKDAEVVRGVLSIEGGSGEQATEVALHLAPLLRPEKWKGYNEKVFDWIRGAWQKHPSLFNWVGVYFKADFLLDEKSQDLILGPFIGASTEHVRIPLDRGLCGLALREEKVVNVDDVRTQKEHIACSLSTRSELVIPLGSDGNYVAELDIDSDTVSAFDSAVEKEMREYAKTFPLPE